MPLSPEPITLALRSQAYQRVMEELRKRQAEKLKYDWGRNARPKQLPPPGDWRVWLILAGRGFGKTRTGAETLRQWVRENKARRIALIAATDDEARQIMVEGVSGLLAVHPPHERPKFEPTNHRLVWPNGAVASLYSADSYERLRGPQFDCAWVDELAKFRYADQAWAQLNFCLRLGDHPRMIVTTTPRPTPLLQSLLAQAGKNVALTQGSTFENKDHLSGAFLDTVKSHYEGTQLGRQELMGEMILQNDQALWTRDLLDRARVQTLPSLSRVVVAIDPAVTKRKTSDETAIIVAGRDAQGHGYVLEDLSGRLEASAWAKRAVKAYHQHQADRIIAEVNQGGDLVEKMIRLEDPMASYKGLRATRGKALRAEPIAALYEQGKIHHIGCGNALKALEDQLCQFIPGETKHSPDRLDALVWAMTELLLYSQNRSGRVWQV